MSHSQTDSSDLAFIHTLNPQRTSHVPLWSIIWLSHPHDHECHCGYGSKPVCTPYCVNFSSYFSSLKKILDLCISLDMYAFINSSWWLSISIHLHSLIKIKLALWNISGFVCDGIALCGPSWSWGCLLVPRLSRVLELHVWANMPSFLSKLLRFDLLVFVVTLSQPSWQMPSLFPCRAAIS